MRQNAKGRASVEHITDEDIASIISYLDPNPGGKGKETGDEANTVFVICVSLMILVVSVLAYIWLYLRVS